MLGVLSGFKRSSEVMEVSLAVAGWICDRCEPELKVWTACGIVQAVKFAAW